MKMAKQQVAMAFAVGFGAGSLFVSWFILYQNQHAYSDLAQQVEEVNTHLAGFENAFNAMDVELRQLKIALNNDGKTYVNELTVQNTGQLSNDRAGDLNSAVDTDSADNDSPAAVKNDALTDQELSRVTLVVDKLRAHDMATFPDFPSLMASAEVTNLSPHALDKIMAEVSRMVDQGELDSSFFPNK